MGVDGNAKRRASSNDALNMACEYRVFAGSTTITSSGHERLSFINTIQSVDGEIWLGLNVLTRRFAPIRTNSCVGFGPRFMCMHDAGRYHRLVRLDTSAVSADFVPVGDGPVRSLERHPQALLQNGFPTYGLMQERAKETFAFADETERMKPSVVLGGKNDGVAINQQGSSSPPYSFLSHSAARSHLDISTGRGAWDWREWTIGMPANSQSSGAPAICVHQGDGFERDRSRDRDSKPTARWRQQ